MGRAFLKGGSGNGESGIGSHLVVNRSHEGDTSSYISPLTLEYYQNIYADENFNNISLVTGEEEVPTIISIETDNETLKLEFEGKLSPETTYILNIPLNAVKDKLGNTLNGVYQYSFTTEYYEREFLYFIESGTSSGDINGCLSVAPSNSKIHFSEGTFNITSSLNITKSNITLQGIPNKTILLNNKTSEDIGIINITGTPESPINNITIDSFVFDGNISNDKTGHGIKISNAGTSFVNKTENYISSYASESYENFDGVSIIDCVIENNSECGVYITESVNCHITNNLIQLNSESGILMDSNSDNNIVDNNIIQNNNYHGIRAYSSTNNILDANIIKNNSLSGINLESSDNNIIAKNTLQNNGLYGAHLYLSNGNGLTGNTSQNNNDRGIYLESSNYNTVCANTIQNNNSYGLCISGSAYNNADGNVVESNANNGIIIMSSNRNMLLSNISKINTTYDIVVYDIDSSNNFLAFNESTIIISDSGTDTTLQYNTNE
jgi:parallel beta-helix repeat protein